MDCGSSYPFTSNISKTTILSDPSTSLVLPPLFPSHPTILPTNPNPPMTMLLMPFSSNDDEDDDEEGVTSCHRSLLMIVDTGVRDEDDESWVNSSGRAGWILMNAWMRPSHLEGE